jgi:hypothetical protein
MSVFGPKVPAPLQGIIHHAERFCDLLSHREGIAGIETDTRAAARRR